MIKETLPGPFLDNFRGSLLHLPPAGCFEANRRQGPAADPAQSGQDLFLAKGTVAGAVFPDRANYLRPDESGADIHGDRGPGSAVRGPVGC